MIIACWLRRCCDLPPSGCKLAHKPARLQRIIEPGFGPAALQTTPYDGRVDILTVEIEQWQFPARLVETASQVKQFRHGWKVTFQLIVIQR